MTATLPSRHPWTVLLMPALVLAALLAGCASGPKPGASPRPALFPDRDGPEANPPKDLALVPDAEPRVETLRSGGPNRPYEVLGRRYVPIAQDRPFSEVGLASWYGRKFHGKRTASGEVYDMYAMTAAHPTLPLPSYARVRNPVNGREVVVRVNDRGPFHPGRIIDLSYTAALKLDLLRGVAVVEVERITLESIRAGTWRVEPRSESRRLAGAMADAAAETANVVVAAGTPVPLPAQQSTEDLPSPAPAASGPDANTVAGPGAAAGPNATSNATSNAAPALPELAHGNGFWVQLGAFRQRDGAESFQRRVAAELDWPLGRLAVFSDASLFRLQAGPYASRDEARSAAERIRSALLLVPVLLERR